MIKYYSIDQENFNPKNYTNSDHIELIKTLVNRLFFSNIRLVSDSDNSTIKSLKQSFKYINSITSRKSIEKKLMYLIIHNKIRKSQHENINNLHNNLNKYPFYDGKFVFDEEDENETNLLIERNSDFLMEELKLQSKGILFNQNDCDQNLIRAMLGSTYIRFGVFNFIDSIHQIDTEHDTFFSKKVLSESLEYFLKIFLLAQSNEYNFFFRNNDQKKLIIYCSTRSIDFDSSYKSKAEAAMVKFYKEDLYERKYINSFVESGGKIQVYVFPRYDYDNNENEDREDLHERFIGTQNGVFSMSKDLDIFKWNKEKKDYERRPIKFGYHSDFHSFSEKSKNNNFHTTPHIINLEN